MVAPIAFISDVHSNFVALEAVLERIDSLGIDTIFCAGDVAGYHTQINECCNTLRERGVRTVMGNHDWYLSGNGLSHRSKSVDSVIQFQSEIITRENLQWMQNLPLQITTEAFRMVHGSWSNPLDHYIEGEESDFAGLGRGVFITGHSHIPVVREFSFGTYCNPGSVGQPRDFDPRASFAVLQDGRFRIERVNFDIDKVVCLMKNNGFGEWHYGGLYTGSAKLIAHDPDKIVFPH